MEHYRAATGEYLLTGFCPESTVLHELSHSREFLDLEKYKNLRKFNEAEERARKAIDDGRKAKAAGNRAAVSNEFLSSFGVKRKSSKRQESEVAERRDSAIDEG
jgi:hypothetical protein